MIKLYDYNKKPIYINSYNITSVESDTEDDKYTTIYFEKCIRIVCGNVDEIAKCLDFKFECIAPFTFEKRNNYYHQPVVSGTL